MSALILPEVPWGRIARVYGQSISPIYKSIQNMLIEDVDHVVNLLSGLEPLEEDLKSDVSFIEVNKLALFIKI
jgi:hypothetical protein